MPEYPREPKKRSSAPLATFVIIVLVGVLFMAWSFFTGSLPWQLKQEGESPRISWMDTKSGQQEITPQDETAQAEKDSSTSLQPAAGIDQYFPASQNECRQTADKILLFFDTLDRQNYISSYAVQGSTLDHFRGVINKLMANPPVVVRETDDLFAILNNMAHFFRVLGPKDILFIKDVLIHERESIEPAMALFYKWSEIAPDCASTGLDIALPLGGLYEYAGYFINTLGGQSYLFRREVYLRLLIRYYSTLIIDRANSVDANRYGIDIRYTLDSLISEMQGNGALVNRQEYLNNLIRLLENYQAKYGSN